MTAYLDWNREIVHAVTADVEQGSPVYLDIDEERIQRIGLYRLNYADGEESLEAFLAAVRETCVRSQRINSSALFAAGSKGPPSCVGLLATLVLAAYDMGDDQAAAANNFFVPLRRRLGLSLQEQGRPAGFEPKYEERFWEIWNQWLIAGRWTPTAYPGQGATQYINYARSQTLLRAADRNNLIRTYGDRPALLVEARRWDHSRHLSWLARHETHGLTANLRATLESPDPDRRNALGRAVAELVADLDEQGGGRRSSGAGRPRCGLYRMVHPLTGAARFLAFLQFPGDIPVEGAAVLTDTARLPLERFKGLWTKPLAVPDLLTRVSALRIEGLAALDEISVPEREHWILVRDPDDPSRGDYATWREPELGETFIILGRFKCAEQLDLLREEGLLQWKGEPRQVPGLPDWLEWHDCKVLSPSWEHVNPVFPELFDELRPSRFAIGINFRGGLPGPFRNSWMQGHPPSVHTAVFGRHWMSIRRADRKETLPIEALVGEQEMALPPDLPAGDYLLEVLPGDQDPAVDGATPLRVRSFHIVAWDALEPVQGDQELVAEGPGFAIQGAVIREYEELADEGASG
ncbi:MAG: hypothetical protein U9Q81_19215 [Pseudomonadota bacterium]|nr:hypothetical protein [Pseudomonadota bacterium]